MFATYWCQILLISHMKITHKFIIDFSLLLTRNKEHKKNVRKRKEEIDKVVFNTSFFTSTCNAFFHYKTHFFFDTESTHLNMKRKKKLKKVSADSLLQKEDPKEK